MDEKNLKNKEQLLRLLEKNGRISINALCKKLNLSRTSVYSQMKALQDDGTIKKFTIERGDVDKSLEIKTYALIRYDVNRALEIFREIILSPYVHKMELLFGEFDALVTYHMDSMLTVDEIRIKLHNIEGIHDVHTLIVQRQVNGDNVDIFHSRVD